MRLPLASLLVEANLDRNVRLSGFAVSRSLDGHLQSFNRMRWFEQQVLVVRQQGRLLEWVLDEVHLVAVATPVEKAALGGGKE